MALSNMPIAEAKAALDPAPAGEPAPTVTPDIAGVLADPGQGHWP